MSREDLVRVDDGTVLWTETTGNGPPLVLCHGGPGWWDYLAPLAGLVDDIRTVHRWDQRGSGRSSARGPYSISRFLADLDCLRDVFGHASWSVGGHSWGAKLALLYALRHPDRVDAVVYISGTGLGGAWNAAYHTEQLARLTPADRARFRALKGKRRTPTEEHEFLVLNAAPDFADRERARALAEQLVTDAFRPNYDCNQAIGREVQALDEAELAEQCRTFAAPVLILHGADDPRPAWALDSLAAALPRRRLLVLPHVGHWPWQEDPAATRAALHDFFAATA